MMSEILTVALAEEEEFEIMDEMVIDCTVHRKMNPALYEKLFRAIQLSKTSKALIESQFV